MAEGALGIYNNCICHYQDSLGMNGNIHPKTAAVDIWRA
jgi:hypothetical protein